MESFLLFLFKPFLQGAAEEEEGAEDYYSVLGVPRTASTQEIRRAYKKQSLQMHPDKLKQRGVEVTQEHSERFARLKEYADVLTDPKKRRVYDEVGESGVLILEGTKDPSVLMTNFAKSKRSDRCRIVGLIFFFFALLLLVPILVGLKIDGTITGPWMAVWTPVWIVDLLMVLNTIALLTAEEEPPSGEDGEPEEEDWVPTLTPAVKAESAIRTVLSVTFQILLLLKLDGDVGYDWHIAFIPWLLWELVTLVVNTKDALATVERPDVGSLPQDEHDDLIFSQVYMSYAESVLERDAARETVAISLLRILFLALLAVKLDDNAGYSYYVVFLPLWLYIGLELFVNMLAYRHGGQLMGAIDPEVIMTNPESLPPETQVNLMLGHMYRSRCSAGCFRLVFIVVVGTLIAAKAAGASYSAIIIFVPSFIIAGCIFCLICCAIMGVSDETLAEDDDDLYGSRGYNAPGEAEGDDDIEKGGTDTSAGENGSASSDADAADGASGSAAVPSSDASTESADVARSDQGLLSGEEGASNTNSAGSTEATSTAIVDAENVDLEGID